MDFEVVWNADGVVSQDDSRLAVVNAKHIAPGANASSQLVNQFIESFCLPLFFVVVSFDSIPLSSASVCISVARPLRPRIGRVSKPARVHYGFATTHAHQWSDQPQNSRFYQLAHDPFLFLADFDMSLCEANVLGLSFVFQLEDGTWLKNFGQDFYVGGGERTVPCSVEVPFPHPMNIEVVRGQMLSLYRTNPFWLQPMFGGDGLNSCRQETQFVLAAVNSSPTQPRQEQSHEGVSFVAILPIIDTVCEIRTSLFGVGERQYSAMRLETGRCSPLRFDEICNAKVCVATFAGNPYDAIRFVVDAAAHVVKTFCSRNRKLSSSRWQQMKSAQCAGVLNSLGYCTWDAFGHSVTERDAVDALRWLKKEDISIGYAIVDDGWQAGGASGPNCEHSAKAAEGTGRPTLSSFRANEKFAGSLRSLAQSSGTEIVAWSAIIGYWGGSNGLRCNSETMQVRGALSRGLYMNGAEDPSFWVKGYEIVRPFHDTVEKFFYNYFVKSMALEQGISGVKVDAQSILEILCNPRCQSQESKIISRSSITSTYRFAMTKAVEHAFPETVVVNCMACGPETIFLSGCELTSANACWRTSNDHAFPGVEECADSVSWHVLCNSMTSVFLGELFPVTDWDMFRVCDKFADMHLAARIMSGGPLYFSDTTPFATADREHARNLLHRLTTSSKRILRCENPGRPTLDCLFQDPREQPVQLFKIFNRTAVLGLIGLFNLGSRTENGKPLSGSFAPADVEDFAKSPAQCQYISVVTTGEAANLAFHHRNRSHSCRVTLQEMSASLVHVCPVFRIAKRIRFAVLGQPQFTNCGAAVASISFVVNSHNLHCTVECSLHDCGRTYVWLDDFSLHSLANVTGPAGNAVEDHVLLEIGSLRFLAINVPSAKPYGIRLSFRDKE